jgi:hypothetical protein
MAMSQKSWANSSIIATIIQGRYDIVCPPQTAWDLHKGLPDSDCDQHQESKTTASPASPCADPKLSAAGRQYHSGPG